MVAFSAAILLFILGLRLFLSTLEGPKFSLRSENRKLHEVKSLLLELEETLTTGLVPDPARWKAARALQAPWDTVVEESVQALRSAGGAVLPTLRRLRILAQEHSASLADARARSAQSLAQAGACALLVPLFGGVLAALLPGIAESGWRWWAVCGVAELGAAGGAWWMLWLSEKARWGGLPRAKRNWSLATNCAGEAFLAWVRAGNPPDIAWVRCCETLGKEAPGLASHWGRSLWVTQPTIRDTDPFIETGAAIRRAVHLSLMEGRPCIERVESVLLSFRQQFKAKVDQELSVLPTRTLKPLFLCVAPTLLGLLGAGLWQTWVHSN